MPNKFLIYALLLPLWLSAIRPTSAHADQAIVHAVLFYSPTCGHCHLVITEVLPPLVEQYGEQLYVVGIDVTQPAGQTLFLATLQHFGLERGGVPFLVVGETYLVGSIDIPEKFPGLIEQYLAQGGVGWPEIPGLVEAMTAGEDIAAPTPTQPAAPTQGSVTQASPTQPVLTPSLAAPVATPTMTAGLILTGNVTLSPWERFKLDPAGNSLAVVVLIGMALSVVGGTLFFRRTPSMAPRASWDWLIPVLCSVGLGVAGYLAYVETAQVEAVCGPVGDCNTVQQSEYARLFGLLPIGVLGLAGYVMILLAWGIERWANQRLAGYASLAIFGMTTFGLLFSIYLTFLEPFVIGATCAWCLTSAIIMTLLFWLSLAPAKDNFKLIGSLIRMPQRGEQHG